MNRRDALKLLTALPMVKTVEVARLEPNDVVVIESDEYLTVDQRTNIGKEAIKIWPNHKVIVLDHSMRLRIAKG